MDLRTFANILVTLWCLSYPSSTWTAVPHTLNPSSPFSVDVDMERQSDGNENEDPYSNFLYYEKTETYYAYNGIQNQGPCGKFMKLYKESNNSNNGVCLCEKAITTCPGRPLLYWKETQRCYYAYEQGPCGNREWLINDNKGEPYCQRNPCPLTEDSMDNKYEILSYIFYFKYQDTCYRTNTTAFCEDGKRLFLLKTEPGPICLTDEPKCFVGYTLAYSKPHKCPPNTNLQKDGSCAKIITYM